MTLALLAAAGSAMGQAANSPTPVTAADRAIGSPDAPVTVIEYGSFACHNCADWHQFVWPLFKQRLIDTGQVRFVFRNLPTSPIEMSMSGAALARCSAPDRFFDVAAVLMSGQTAVLRGGSRDEWLSAGIDASGRSRDQIEVCVNAEATRAEINRDVEGARALGVTGTPTFFVNGQRVQDRSLGGLELAVRAAQAG